MIEEDQGFKGVLADRNACFCPDVSSNTGTLRFDELEDKSDCHEWTLEHEFALERSSDREQTRRTPRNYSFGERVP
jgi:hypothetical protein